MDKTVEAFKDAQWTIPEDFMEFSHYKRTLLRLDWTSSPGYPYMRRCPTNKDFFKVNEGVPDEGRVLHVWDILRQRLTERDCDPVRLFIKPEPHKIEKIKEGRYRLISSVSVVDQIIDHMLFGEMNDQLVNNWAYVPSKIGWSQYLGGWRYMPHQQDSVMALDRKSWDWTMQIWLIEMVLEVRAALCLNLSEEWLELAKWRYKSLFVKNTFITSGGLLLRQKHPGVMKSGCVNTISDNSIAQHLVNGRVCMEIDEEPSFLISMGDDTLQTTPENLEQYLQTMAQYCIVKPPSFECEFAGMRFHGKRIEPCYRGKHAYVLLHVDPEVLPQLADSYALLYHRSNARNLMEDVLSKMVGSLVSRSKREVIYDGL